MSLISYMVIVDNITALLFKFPNQIPQFAWGKMQSQPEIRHGASKEDLLVSDQ